ncbi:hypothetical protein ACTA71_003980 [Dictyostelium dimigraforme]
MEHINYSFIDLLVDKEKGEEFSCKICTELIFGVKVFQCKEGHWFCNKCWEKSLSKKSECMQCKCHVGSINDLSRLRYLENKFEELKVRCRNSFNNNKLGNKLLKKDEEKGCKSIVNVDKLNLHINECPHQHTKCPNEPCQIIPRKNELIEHDKICHYKKLVCECNESIFRISFELHRDIFCKKGTMECGKCKIIIERNKMENHLSDDCPEIFVPCTFKKHGCRAIIKRSNLNDHLHSGTHIAYIAKIIEEQENQIIELRENQKNLASEILLLRDNIKSIK